MNTDSELVSATLAGNKSAFGVLTLRYQTQVYRLVYRIIDNQANTSDIVQEALLKAYQNLETLRNRDRFSTWLFRIAKNQCISWNRKYQRNVRENIMGIENELVNDHLHLPPAPDEAMIESELHGQIMKAIARLPEYNREAVQMFYIEGKSYSEIQEKLGITKGTLGRFLYEARAQLRTSLRTFQAVILLAGQTLRGVSRLASRNTTGATTVASTGKYIATSVILHLAFFAGMAGTELNWGVSNGFGNGAEEIQNMAVTLVEASPSQIIAHPLFITENSSLSTPAHRRFIETSQRSISTLTVPNRKPDSTKTGIRQVSPVVSGVDANSTALPLLDISKSSQSRLLPENGVAQVGINPDGHSSRTRTRFLSGLKQKYILNKIATKPTASISDTIAESYSDTESNFSDNKRTPPSSYGTLDKNSKAVRNMGEMLRMMHYRGRITQYSAAAFQAITKSSRFSRVVVSQCDLEVLKTFVALDVPPIVVIRNPMGAKHIRAVVEYSDLTERIALIDPTNGTATRFSYSDFINQWDDPQDACLLVFPQRIITPKAIEISLTKYLPLEKIDTISIKASKRR